MTNRSNPTWTACHACNRGGCGNDPDKCSCGWRITEPSTLGCFLGTPIVGEPTKPPKLTRSQRRYRYFIDSGLSETLSYHDFLKNERNYREFAQEKGLRWY